MSFPIYPSYRSSGLEWVPSLPTHWSSARLRWIAGRYAGGTPDKNKDVYWEDGTVPWLNSGAVNQGLVQEPSAFITEEALANSSARWVPAGALLMALAGQGKTKGMVAQLGFRATCNQSMAAVVPGDELAARYLLWWLSANYQNIRNMSGGDNRDGLNLELLGDIPCPLPPIREQAAIAAFLDRETAKIDALVEQQRRLIELLKEKRQAVVSHAATKGLDPNVPMKDSDVEWLGEVPAHWGVVQSRRLFAVRSEPALESDKMLTASQKYGVIFQSDFVELEGRRVVEVILGKANLKHVEPNDFIISMRSFQGGLEWSRLRGSTSFHYVMIKPQKWVHPPYYAHLFKSMNYIQALRATTDLIRDGQELRYSNFTQVPLPVVPVEEQKLIAIYVDRTVEKLGRLSAEAAKSIELMQEHRAALISAAVTGKIDVRENAKVLPFPTDRSRARSLVAAEIIERSAHQATFGRVKLQKIAFLAETHLGIGELAGSYTREAAGPLDRALITEMENGARSMSGATVDQSGGAGTVVSYRLGQQLGAHRHELADWLGEGRIARLDRLIADFASLSTKGAEAVATLYAVWNDALIEGASPTDEEIIAAFLNDWHPEKREKFRADELPAWLDWMRRHGIVPTGNGPKTSTGRLLV